MTNEKIPAPSYCARALHGAYGLKGWVRVQPFQGTSALLGSKHWQHVLPDGEVRPVELEKAKLHGAGIVAKFQVSIPLRMRRRFAVQSPFTARIFLKPKRTNITGSI